MSASTAFFFFFNDDDDEDVMRGMELTLLVVFCYLKKKEKGLIEIQI